MDALASLVDRLPRGTVSTHHGELATHAHDRRAVALLREARGDRVPPPTAVVFPRSTDQVSAVLAWAQETGTAIVPRGGATGIRGGAEAVVRSVVLDLTKMNRVLAIDEVSQMVRAQGGARGGDVEAALAARRLTAGHVLESLGLSTVGGWIASASAGLASAGYGAIEDHLLGLTAVLAGGDVLELEPAPRTGVGPNLRALFVGSEGTLGVITEATLSAFRMPSGFAWDAFRAQSFDAGVALVREVVQHGYRPLVLALLDEAEMELAFAGEALSGAGALVGFDAGAPAAEAVRFELGRLAREVGARPLERPLAERWWDHRHEGVERYERAMGPERALGKGVIVDRFEVANVWRRIPGTYEEVRGALLEHVERVGCRLLHPSVTGAALEFAFDVRDRDDRSVERRYLEAWRAAGEAALRAGATVAHHHGVGLVMLPFVAREVGPVGGRMLRQVKAAFDPAGVLNPGKLLPP